MLFHLGKLWLSETEYSSSGMQQIQLLWSLDSHSTHTPTGQSCNLQVKLGSNKLGFYKFLVTTHFFQLHVYYIPNPGYNKNPVLKNRFGLSQAVCYNLNWLHFQFYKFLINFKSIILNINMHPENEGSCYFEL